MSTENQVKLQDLTLEQKKQLLQEAKQDLKDQKLKKAENYTAFKELSAEFVSRNISPLLDLHILNEKAILSLFQDFEPVLAIRKELYGDKPQDSYTSTLPDGSQSITIGHNVIISFDGTESEGVQKIKEYLATLASDDDNAKKLSASLNLLLKPNGKTGMLKPNVVLQLNALRDQYNDENFDEGIEIIEKAQIFTRTTQYVRGWAYVNGEAGQRKKLTFSFSV
jgi:vesicle coat complex subunit